MHISLYRTVLLVLHPPQPSIFKDGSAFSLLHICTLYSILYSLCRYIKGVLPADDPMCKLQCFVQSLGEGAHRVERVLGFFSSRPNWDPQPLTPRRVCPSLAHSLAGEGVGVPIRTRDRHCGTLGIYVLCEGACLPRPPPHIPGYYLLDRVNRTLCKFSI
jgi:hypothetical protein